MMSLLTSGLFAAGFFLAIAVMAASWRAYGAEVLSLRQQLAECVSVRELRFVKITTHVRVETAEVWRPGIRPLASRQFRPNLRPSLRAAA